jgi:hypothetical protein
VRSQPRRCEREQQGLTSHSRLSVTGTAISAIISV